MKKELSPSLEMVACDVCGRTILKGERTEPYMVPDGTRRLVCELCVRRAESAGWLRESLHGDLPATTPRAEPRRSLLGRLRRRFEPGPAAADTPPPADAYREQWGEPAPVPADDRPRAAPAYEEPADASSYEPSAPYPDETGLVNEDAFSDEPEPSPRAPLEEARPPDTTVPPNGEAPLPERGTTEEPLADDPAATDLLAPDGSLLREPGPAELAFEAELSPDTRAARRERRNRRRLRDPRHVRAVPTGAEAKVERALEIFNLSDYRRTVGGLVRTLGKPWVTALPHEGSTGEVTVVVAWELSWYQFRIDLGDADEPVAVADKGHEVDEIDADLQRWNATATEDGALEPVAPAP